MKIESLNIDLSTEKLGCEGKSDMGLGGFFLVWGCGSCFVLFLCFCVFFFVLILERLELFYGL